MPAPRGFGEIVERFGDPRKFVLPDGTLSPSWEQNYIVRVELPAPLRLDLLHTTDEPMVTRVTAHKLVADRLKEVLEYVYENGWWEGLGGYSGGYAWRPQRNSRKISTHAWGLAWDFGATRDPLGDTDIDMPLEIVKVFEAYDFEWGGRWSRKDAMHFQFAKGY